MKNKEEKLVPGIDTMEFNIKDLVSCSFQHKCKNFGKLCNKCRWNSKLEIKDHLLIEENGRTIRFL